jgi:hypothetical protein
MSVNGSPDARIARSVFGRDTGVDRVRRILVFGVIPASIAFATVFLTLYPGWEVESTQLAVCTVAAAEAGRRETPSRRGMVAWGFRGAIALACWRVIAGFSAFLFA